jgi:hypothetical protein
MLPDRHIVWFFSAAKISPSLSCHRPTECFSSLTEGAVMSSAGAARAITTLASVAAVACGLFAFSWVSLALLGF